MRLHDCRHACGSLLVSLGAKPKLVQRILRHSRLEATMNLYVHAFDDDVRDAGDVLGKAIVGAAWLHSWLHKTEPGAETPGLAVGDAGFEPATSAM